MPEESVCPCGGQPGSRLKLQRPAPQNGDEVSDFLVWKNFESAWPKLTADSFIDDTATKCWKNDGEWVCDMDCAHRIVVRVNPEWFETNEGLTSCAILN